MQALIQITKGLATKQYSRLWYLGHKFQCRGLWIIFICSLKFSVNFLSLVYNVFIEYKLFQLFQTIFFLVMFHLIYYLNLIGLNFVQLLQAQLIGPGQTSMQCCRLYPMDVGQYVEELINTDQPNLFTFFLSRTLLTYQLRTFLINSKLGLLGANSEPLPQSEEFIR